MDTDAWPPRNFRWAAHGRLTHAPCRGNKLHCPYLAPIMLEVAHILIHFNPPVCPISPGLPPVCPACPPILVISRRFVLYSFILPSVYVCSRRHSWHSWKHSWAFMEAFVEAFMGIHGGIHGHSWAFMEAFMEACMGIHTYKPQ